MAMVGTRSGRLPAILALATACGASASAGCAPPATTVVTTIDWSISFDTPARAASAHHLEAEVREGSCTGPLVWGPETIARGGATPMPPGMLDSGPYCLRAVAIDAGCVRFASASTVQTLARSGETTVELVLTPMDAERECPPLVCRDGACVDALRDAGPPDVGIDADFVPIDSDLIFPDSGPPPDSDVRYPDAGPPDELGPLGTGCRPLTGASLVAAGGNHTCAQVEQRLFCWGADDEGQLGAGTVRHESRVPVLVEREAGASVWMSLTAGEAHTCGIDAMSQLFCWGSNSHGQLGVVGPSRARPTQVAAGTRFSAVAAGARHTCAIAVPMMGGFGDGEVWCWGANDARQMGTPTPSAGITAPGPVASLTGMSVSAPAAGAEHTCALVRDLMAFTQATVCWGADGPWLGREGPDDGTPSVLAGSGFIGLLTAGDRHACRTRFETTSGFECWGDGTSGQLASGLSTASTTAIPSPLWSNVVLSSAGGAFTCTTTAREPLFMPSVACVGEGSDGATGPRGSDAVTLSPLVVLRDGSNPEAGQRHACASVSGTGELVCWGANDRGQLGTGRAAAIDRTPTPVCL